MAGFGHSLDVSVEGDGRVKGDSQITDLSEWMMMCSLLIENGMSGEGS